MTRYFLLLFLIIIGCTQQRSIKTYYDAGALFEMIEISEDSIRNGLYLRYAENGDTLEKSYYIDGKLNGSRILYFDNNKIEIIENYHNDSLEGLYTVFYEDGGKSLESVYSNNILTGVVKRYFPSGNLMEEVTFENNQENGPFVEYFESGGKKWEGTYKDGDNEFGLLVEFAENGDTIKKMMCDERFICTTIYRNPDYPSEE